MKNLAIGIDIGGTNTEIGLCDNQSKIIALKKFKTQDYQSELSYISTLIENIQLIIDEIPSDSELLGIGIGSPNGNFYTGRIEQAPNLNWAKNVPIVNLLKEKLKYPIFLTNDANAAALGEKVYGGAKNYDDFIVITLGTGLGSGIFANGKLLRGYTGFGGEIGHINAIPNGRLCGCGKKGCLETYVSSTGIKVTVSEMIQITKRDSILKKFKFAEIDSYEIFQAAKQNDKIALEAFEFTSEILGKKLADIIAIFNPNAIFLTGGLAKAGDLLLSPVRKYTEENVMPIFKNKTKIEISKLIDSNAGILGAAALVFNELNIK